MSGASGVSLERVEKIEKALKAVEEAVRAVGERLGLIENRQTGMNDALSAMRGEVVAAHKAALEVEGVQLRHGLMLAALTRRVDALEGGSSPGNGEDGVLLSEEGLAITDNDGTPIRLSTRQDASA